MCIGVCAIVVYSEAACRERDFLNVMNLCCVWTEWASELRANPSIAAATIDDLTEKFIEGSLVLSLASENHSH